MNVMRTANYLLSPSLSFEMNYDDIVAVLGEPQEEGKGLRGFTILAYRERTVQCTMFAGRLFLLAFYFHQNAGALLDWPRCFAALHDFSSTMNPSNVEGWLVQQGVPFLRSSVCGEEVIKAQIGVSFCFESGLLSSIQIISEAPTPDSPPQAPRG
jgi:hypothetical protein